MPSVAVKNDAGSIFKIPKRHIKEAPLSKVILNLGYTGPNDTGYKSFLVSTLWSYLCPFLHCALTRVSYAIDVLQEDGTAAWIRPALSTSCADRVAP
jgi:hypothetical protein